MAVEQKQTFVGYLGPQYQLKSFWQLLTEGEFAEAVIPLLHVDYYDDATYKRFFIILKEYFNEFKKPANLQNKSIFHAIKKFSNSNDSTDEEILLSVVEKIKNWNDRVLNKQLDYDGDIVQKEIFNFIKQQEYRKLADFINLTVRNGNIKSDKVLNEIQEKIKIIAEIGDDEDFGIEVFENIKNALEKDYRRPISTGIKVLDEVMGGGLGNGEIGIIVAPSGYGKAQPLSSKILTPTGWTTMDKIKIDDLVIGSDGKSQKVLNIFPQGKRPIYKVKFSDQTEVLCDEEHLWSVNSNKQRNVKTKINGKNILIPDYTFQTLKLKEMMDDVRLKNGKRNYRLPNLLPVNFVKIDIDIDPYILGLLLGDGCVTKKNQPHIITTDDHIVKEYKNILSENLNILKYDFPEKNRKKIHRLSLLGFREKLEKYNLYGCDNSNKFIPKEYLINSKENREKLLQGLIDTDGTISKNGGIIYTTVSKKLSINVKELILSLGGTCRINEKKSYYKNNKNEKKLFKISYNLNISFPNNGIIPCTLPKKLKRFKYRDKYTYNKFIDSIEYSHEEDAKCILVENEDSLYVTNDYVLTHNTTLLTKIANTAHSVGKNVLQIVFEDTENQIRRKHFAIWTKKGLSEFEGNEEEIEKEIIEYQSKNKDKFGELRIIRLSQDGTTIPMIKKWIDRYQKKFGITFDIIILDYIDCVDSHKFNKNSDQNSNELSVIKAFESMGNEYNIPCWSAIQTNRSGFNSEFVKHEQSGGNIKRVQKSHFLMSIAKTDDQKEEDLANIAILKARFAKDGYLFKDCIFNNDTLEIRITDSFVKNKCLKVKKIKQEDVDKFNEEMAKKNNKTEESKVEKFNIQTKEDALNLINEIKNNKNDISDEGKDLLTNLMNQST